MEIELMLFLLGRLILKGKSLKGKLLEILWEIHNKG
jgi:hypothetical protein